MITDYKDFSSRACNITRYSTFSVNNWRFKLLVMHSKNAFFSLILT